jgi:hypothetical protein
MRATGRLDMLGADRQALATLGVEFFRILEPQSA